MVLFYLILVSRLRLKTVIYGYREQEGEQTITIKMCMFYHYQDVYVLSEIYI